VVSLEENLSEIREEDYGWMASPDEEIRSSLEWQTVIQLSGKGEAETADSEVKAVVKYHTND